MYEVCTIEDKVRVPPESLGQNKREAIKKALAEKFENKIVYDVQGVVLGIIEIVKVGQGRLIVDDPCIHYPVKFKALVFKPLLNEVVQGQVVDITEFGIFVRFGPIDALCHISQITNEYLSYDRKNVTLFARESKRSLKIGHIVRARIIGVSMKKGENNKILLTMRQPGLGPLEWIIQERQEKEKKEKKK